MFRIAPRLIARPTAFRAVPRSFAAPPRRLASTAPPSQKSRSWKSLGARIGIAGAIIYFYNTTEAFAESPQQHAVHSLPETEIEAEHLPTIESLSSERQKRKAVQAQLELQKQKQKEEEAARAQNNAATATQVKGGMEGLEEEADQQSAFNPETGEINWDCPCLGGMAHGPCGEEFKAAFSCFVYSKEEPKGMDCIENFKGMQNCFRQHPGVYGSELDSDADDEEEEEHDVTANAATAAPPAQEASNPTNPVSPPSTTSSEIRPTPASPSSKQENPLSDPKESSKSNKPKESSESDESSSKHISPISDSSLVPDNYKPGKH